MNERYIYLLRDFLQEQRVIRSKNILEFYVLYQIPLKVRLHQLLKHPKHLKLPQPKESHNNLRQNPEPVHKHYLLPAVRHN